MSAWPGKYVIGLTGNIATGKSVIRRMLEHLGAYSIDADALTHRAMAQGAPGYEPIVRHFGAWIVGANGQIDRARLGKIAFADPDALKKLEEILHPLVRQAIDLLIRRAIQPVVVIEAIKLLEGGLAQMCDSIWVVDASPARQLERLMAKRGLSESEAKARLASQGPQVEKVALADVVIDNNGSFENTWHQVLAAWQTISLPKEAPRAEVAPAAPGAIVVQKAGPKQAERIATFISRHHRAQKRVTRDDIMAAFGEKAFMLVLKDESIVGVAGWQVENLVTRVVDFYFDPTLPLTEAVPELLAAVEKASQELQSEAALLFLPAEYARHNGLWQSLGYQKREVESLGVRAWEEAARESHIAGTEMFFKQLRVDRVLRPI